MFTYDSIVKNLLKEMPQTLPPPVKTPVRTPATPGTRPATPHPLQPTKPGITPRPKALAKSEDEEKDVTLFKAKRRNLAK
jgi:hypothetical protein